MAERFVSLDAMGRRKSMARPLWEPRSGPCAACPSRRACLTAAGSVPSGGQRLAIAWNQKDGLGRLVGLTSPHLGSGVPT